MERLIITVQAMSSSSENLGVLKLQNTDVARVFPLDAASKRRRKIGAAL